MPGLMFPSLERATHSLVQRRDKVWVVNMTVVWGTRDSQDQGRTCQHFCEGN